MGATINRLLVRYAGFRKILPITLLAIIGLSLFFLIQDYQNGISETKHNEMERLKAIVSTAAALIDGDQHQQLSEEFRKKDDILHSYQIPSYQKLHKLLNAIQLSNNLQSAVYTMVFNSETEKFEFIATSSETPYYRHDYAQYPNAVTQSITAASKLDEYESENGKWLSAIAPITNSEGETVALIQADTEFYPFIAKARKRLLIQLGIGILFLAPFIIGFYWYLKKTTRQSERFQKRLMSKIKQIRLKEKIIEDINESLVENYQEIESQRKIIDHRSMNLQEANDKIGVKNAELMETLEKLRRTQSQLVESEKIHSVGILASGIAHEINNPLNFIHGGVECLKESFKKGELDQVEMETYLGYIDAGVNRASQIISKLSEFTARKDQLGSQLISLNLMAHDAVSELKGDFNIQAIQLRLEEGAWILASKFEIKNLFIQLLKNSCDAVSTVSDGKVKVFGMKKDSMYQITIQDNGEGISERNLKAIFNPFFTTKSPGKGEGLGLFFAQTIIGKYGGTISVKSNEDVGTKVVVSLPLENPQENLSKEGNISESNFKKAS
ncbi:MAG: ATP-binding protein [Bacteroidota bacterium]